MRRSASECVRTNGGRSILNFDSMRRRSTSICTGASISVKYDPGTSIVKRYLNRRQYFDKG